MIDPAFLAMRDQLIARGLICGASLRLTAAGNDHVELLIGELQAAPPPAEPTTQSVRWDRRRVRELA